MRKPSRTYELNRAQHELRREEYETLLRQFSQVKLPLGCFRTWADVLAFMHNGNGEAAMKDGILRAIFECHAVDQDPRWRTVLLAIFWPGLRKIHTQKKSWDSNPEDLWENILWTFFQVICRIDLEKRSDHLVGKIFNDTVHHLHDEYRHQWQRAKSEVPTGPDELDETFAPLGEIDFDRLDMPIAKEREIQQLRTHFEAGRISKSDFLLLVGTRVYRKRVRDFAAKVGISFQTAKKRRQRAEAAIRKFEEGNR